MLVLTDPRTSDCQGKLMLSPAAQQGNFQQQFQLLDVTDEELEDHSKQ